MYSLGNGIVDEYHVIRHVMNLETVNTYEGELVYSNATWTCYFYISQAPMTSMH